MSYQGLQHYKSVDLAASVQTASPHQLIVMLFQGAVESLAVARGAIERKEIELRTQKINKTIDILVNLKASLDDENGGEIAENLSALYDYCVQRLMLANRTNDAEIITEVAKLLAAVADGWASIPPELRRSEN